MALFLGKLSHIQLGDQNRPLAHWSGCSLHIRSGRVHTIHWCKLLNHWMLQATLSSFGSSLGESWSGDAVASEHRVTCILWARWRRRRCCRNDRHLPLSRRLLAACSRRHSRRTLAWVAQGNAGDRRTMGVCNPAGWSWILSAKAGPGSLRCVHITNLHGRLARLRAVSSRPRVLRVSPPYRQP